MSGYSSNTFRYLQLAVLASVLAGGSASASSDPLPSDLLLHGIKLRQGVTASIHVEVRTNALMSRCAVLIHGFQHTGASWEPFADELPASRCVLAINLPGRAQSSLPQGLAFGELLLDDYTTAVIETLKRLKKDYQFQFKTIVGHSSGGLIVQMMQQRLREQGSSLRKEFNIREAVLLAPDPPAEVPFAAADSGVGLFFLALYGMEDPVLGSLMYIPPSDWPHLFFANLAGQVSPLALTPEELSATGYIAPPEPRGVFAQFLGLEGMKRPSATAGMFAHGTRLRLLAFENDPLILTGEGRDTYVHLTGDQSLACFDVVEGTYAVHDLYIADPEAVVSAIRDLVSCKY